MVGGHCCDERQEPPDAAGRWRDGRRPCDRHSRHGRRPVAVRWTSGSIETGQVGEPEQARQGTEGRQGPSPEVAVTVQGTVTKGTDDKGRPTYSVTANGKTWELSAGPSWYWGDKNPLNAYVGKSVSIAGSTHEGETELDVETVDGTALRAPGKPPWAGGPWVVGETHPGWKPWMADGKPGKGLGRENAPGQLKDKTSTN